MYRFIIKIFVFSLLIFSWSCTTQEKDLVAQTGISKISDGYPLIVESDHQIVTHSYFHLSYNEKYEQADWVAYILTARMVENEAAERTDNFRSDPDVATGSAVTSDFTNSGYDRGHLCPAEDMDFSYVAIDETFYMSNMSPQHPSFNRGIWKTLETSVRNWALDNDSIYVITGPIFDNITEFIGKNEVGVPKYFFKIVADISADKGIKAIAYLMPNEKSIESIHYYAITIDELEQKTGYNFFANLVEDVQYQLESSIDTTMWREVARKKKVKQ